MAAKNGEFNERVRRLAQYRPFHQGGRGLEAVLADLVLAATELNGGSFATLAECQAGIKGLWTIEVEIDEIRTARDDLVKAGLAEEEAAGFRLTDGAREELARKAQETEQTEAEALRQWERTIREMRPDLTAEDIESLREDLRVWLGKVIARHGAEAALMLYPEEERAHRLFDEIERFGTDFLQTRSKEVMAVRDDAFKAFIRQPTPEQRTFLANRLNTAFYLTVLTVDPDARHLVEEKASRTRIYIDTNVLYAILGMAPAQETIAAHRLLELSRGLGYQLAVTPWTVAEMHKSIERARRNVEVFGQTFNQGLARLMVRVTGEKGATRTYWESFLKEGLSVKDFFERISAFEDELPRFDIEVVDEGCSRVDDRGKEIDEYAGVLNQIVWPRTRHHEVIEHDVKHRLLIERLRGAGNARFSTASCWFLTQDTKLPTFAKMTPDPEDSPPKLPFCISPSAWVQIVRAMTPRTEDFEDMVVELLASPYVGYQGPLDQRTVREVVARMDRYDDASPELALAVVQDSALMHEIEEADDEQVEERVRTAYSAKAKELKKQAEDAAKVAANEQQAREEAERRERRTRDDLEAEQRRREGVESDLAQMGRKLEDAEKARGEDAARHRGEIERHRSKIDQLEERFEQDRRDRKKRNRVATGAGVAALGLIASSLALLLGLVSGVAAVVVDIGAGALMIAIGVNLALGTQKGTFVMNLISYLLAVVGIVLAVLLSHSP